MTKPLHLKVLKIFLISVFTLNAELLLAQFAGGTGTVEDPYQISNVTQLQAMNTALDKHFILTQNIDAAVTSTWNSGMGFEPIGPTTSTAFLGTFDGKGFKISKLYIARQGTTGVGLFGNFNNPIGAISNVGLDSCAIIGGERVGALVGNKNGIVANCYSTGTVNGTKSSGGLVGRNGFNIINSYSSCTVGGTEEVGGLAGSGANIINSYATGNVTASLGDAGGLIGEISSSGGLVYNSYATGNVTSNNTLYSIGGFIGRMQAGNVELCYSTGNVSGNSVVGGFIGVLNSGFIKRSYTKCTMTLSGGTWAFGGFISENEGNISDCYADVNMTYTGNHSSAKLGGFAGENKDGASIRNAYSVANMTASMGNRAGFVHTNVVDNNDSAKIYNCFWNIDSSSGLQGIFLDQTNSQIVTGLSDVQMKSAANFSVWNFDTIWTITEGQTYPELRRPNSGGGCTNTFAFDTIKACGSFTWINGQTYTSNTDSATHIIANSAGCDSIITLHLTIDTLNADVTKNNNVLSAVESEAGTTYQWINCDNNTPIVNETNQTFTASVTGNYAVILNKNSCVDTSECVNVVVVGVNSIKHKSISVYPNPATSEFNFILNNRSELKIVDALGSIVFTKSFEAGVQTISTNELKNGIYFIWISDVNNTYVSKILISK